MKVQILDSAKENMDLIEKVERVLDFSLFDEIYAGFSGGADSTALLLLLAELSKVHSFNLTAVHFEHGLRGEESLADAAWCREFCQERGIKHFECSLKVPDNVRAGEGTEEAARRLRLEKWNEIVIKKPSSAAALGHHAGDKIENFFIRLLRGSNSSGLTSLRHFSRINGIVFIRPLLDIAREEIIAFLKSAGISDWRNDSTNKLNDYRRNFLRNNVLPELFRAIPNAEKAISSSCSALEDDARFMENEAEAAYRKLKGKDYISAYHDFLPLPGALLIRVLRYWLSEELGYELIPNRALLERLNEEIKFLVAAPKNQERKLIPVSNNIFISIYKDRVSLYKKPNSLSEVVEWHWKEQPEIRFVKYVLRADVVDGKNVDFKQDSKCIAYFALNQIPELFTLRTWRASDKFSPFGFDKELKISKLFQNEKVLPETKETLPLLLVRDTIIWVPGVRRSDFALVSKETSKALKITLCE